MADKQKKFKSTTTSHSLQSQDKHLLLELAVSTVTGSPRFSYAAHAVWSMFPLDDRNSSSLASCLSRGTWSYIIVLVHSLRPTPPSPLLVITRAQGGYIFYAGASLAGANYCRQCRRRPAILQLQLWQGCQGCVKISAQRLPRVAQFNACWVHIGLLALSGQQ